jgi:hypothetical protein
MRLILAEILVPLVPIVAGLTLLWLAKRYHW